MAEKKLTKVQRQILETIRDDPQAQIRIGYLDRTYRLWVGDEITRSITADTFQFLRPWLKEEAKRNAYGQTVYTFREGAEISDDWRGREVFNRRMEAQRLWKEEELRKEEEQRQQAERLKAATTAMATGKIALIEFWSYVVRFEYQGRWYQITEEAPNGR